MKLQLGNREYEMNMGLKALNYLDKVYTTNVGGVELGMGLWLLLADLSVGNVNSLAKFIRAATITEPQKPSDKDIEAYIGSLKGEDFGQAFDDFLDFLKTQPLTAETTKRYGGEIEKAKENGGDIQAV